MKSFKGSVSGSTNIKIANSGVMNNPAFDSSPIAEDDEYDAVKY